VKGILSEVPMMSRDEFWWLTAGLTVHFGLTYCPYLHKKGTDLSYSEQRYYPPPLNLGLAKRPTVDSP